MWKRGNYFFVFFVLLLSIIILKSTDSTFFKGFTSSLENITIPIQRFSWTLFNLPKNIGVSSELERLKEENANLYKKIVDQGELQKENNALKDQFKTTFPKSNSLLPAKIIGGGPETFILEGGTKDNIMVGLAVVFKDNLIGKIERVSTSLSVVTLITNKNSAFAAKTLKTEALGIVRGQGNGEMVLENVLLSDNLEVTDAVLTKGDLNVEMLGYPPNLIAGKIVSLEKKPSALFQSAKVKSLVDFSRLSTVFIVVGY